MSILELRKELKKLANLEKAKLLQGFFKTGKGEYGEGDVFLGVMVPQQRELVKKFWKDINLKEVGELLSSKFHEERLIALLVLVKRYEKLAEERKEIFDFYLKNTKQINNWDLVDLSAPNIVGRYILETGRENPFNNGRLISLSHSDSLWERRISILATFYFIKNKRFVESLEIAKILLDDKHDLIHKAVGWMLREIGKKDQKIEEDFLKKYYKKMPRTMLRYAIEKFDEKKRKMYLNGAIGVV